MVSWGVDGPAEVMGDVASAILLFGFWTGFQGEAVAVAGDDEGPGKGESAFCVAWC
jgi:hypothetical protein